MNNEPNLAAGHISNTVTVHNTVNIYMGTKKCGHLGKGP